MQARIIMQNFLIRWNNFLTRIPSRLKAPVKPLKIYL